MSILDGALRVDGPWTVESERPRPRSQAARLAPGAPRSGFRGPAARRRVSSDDRPVRPDDTGLGDHPFAGKQLTFYVSNLRHAGGLGGIR